MKKKLFVVIILVICANFFFANNLGFRLMSTDATDDTLMKDLRKARGMKIAGIILTSTGGALDIASIAFGVWHQLDPINAPGSIYAGGMTSGYVRADFYINVLVLGLGLGGLGCLGVGIPLMIVGVIKENKIKKQMNKAESMLNKYTPEINFNFATNEVMLGLKIRI